MAMAIVPSVRFRRQDYMERRLFSGAIGAGLLAGEAMAWKPAVEASSNPDKPLPAGRRVLHWD